MFEFRFEGALFRFKAKRPAWDPLFQLPPRSAAPVRRSAARTHASGARNVASG